MLSPNKVDLLRQQTDYFSSQELSEQRLLYNHDDSESRRDAFTLLGTYVVHRRSFETEAKAKVVESVWGDNICSIPCRASYFASFDLEEKLNSSFSFKSTEAK